MSLIAALKVLLHTPRELIASAGGGGDSNLRALLAVHSSTFLFLMTPTVPATIFLQVVRSSAVPLLLSNTAYINAQRKSISRAKPTVHDCSMCGIALR